VASTMYKVLLGCELRMSDMTESRGPEISTVWTLAACRLQRTEVYSTIWVMHDSTQRAMWVVTTRGQLLTDPDEEDLRTASHLVLTRMIRMRLRINATPDKEMLNPVTAFGSADPWAEKPVRRTDWYV